MRHCTNEGTADDDRCAESGRLLCIFSDVARITTDLTVQLHTLQDPEKETIFENCVADVNIPVGEVFTSPTATGDEW